MKVHDIFLNFLHKHESLILSSHQQNSGNSKNVHIAFTGWATERERERKRNVRHHLFTRSYPTWCMPFFTLYLVYWNFLPLCEHWFLHLKFKDFFGFLHQPLAGPWRTNLTSSGRTSTPGRTSTQFPVGLRELGGGSLKVLIHSQYYKEGWASPGMALSSVCCLSEYHDVSQVAV